MMEPRRFYIVRGNASNGTVTYNCPTPEWAMRKYRDLTTLELKDVTITGPDALPMTLEGLEALTNEGAVPRACVPAHQA